MMQSSKFYRRLFQQQLLAASIVVSSLAGAQAQDDNATKLPPVNVAPPELPPAQVLPSSPEPGSAAANPSAAAPCKGDAGAAGKGFGCLNQKLRDQVDQVNPNLTAPTAPLDARSPDLKVGVVNVPGVQQQYGKNFGVSVVPYRPPTAFSAPLGRH